MKTFNVRASLLLSVFILTGFERAQAQIHKNESKQEVKIKEEPKETIPVIEHQETAPVKEEPKEISTSEITPVKEQEIKTEPKPAKDVSSESQVLEKKQ